MGGDDLGGDEPGLDFGGGDDLKLDDAGGGDDVGGEDLDLGLDGGGDLDLARGVHCRAQCYHRSQYGHRQSHDQPEQQIDARWGSLPGFFFGSGAGVWGFG